ncbi:hypothetical protein BDR07DRAFT_1383165 [Suillus spraguei]|nr:hypothetical protein BDR07DRAFT_1383165 [Suillus spraguei]
MAQTMPIVSICMAPVRDCAYGDRACGKCLSAEEALIGHAHAVRTAHVVALVVMSAWLPLGTAPLVKCSGHLPGHTAPTGDCQCGRLLPVIEGSYYRLYIYVVKCILDVSVNQEVMHACGPHGSYTVPYWSRLNRQTLSTGAVPNGSHVCMQILSTDAVLNGSPSDRQTLSTGMVPNGSPLFAHKYTSEYPHENMAPIRDHACAEYLDENMAPIRECAYAEYLPVERAPIGDYMCGDHLPVEN